MWKRPAIFLCQLLSSSILPIINFPQSYVPLDTLDCTCPPVQNIQSKGLQTMVHGPVLSEQLATPPTHISTAWMRYHCHQHHMGISGAFPHACSSSAPPQACVAHLCMCAHQWYHHVRVHLCVCTCQWCHHVCTYMGRRPAHFPNLLFPSSHQAVKVGEL